MIFLLLILGLFFALILSFLLKLDILSWNKLWMEKEINVNLSKTQFFTFLIFLIIFFSNIYLSKNNTKHIILTVILIFILQILSFFIFPTKIIEKFLEKIYLYFYFLNYLFPSKGKKEEDEEKVTDMEKEIFIDMGMEHGILEEKEKKMMENLLDFTETMVKEVMTPRLDIVYISINASYDEIRETFLESKFSRLPVAEESLDNISGIIFLKDFFKILEPSNFNIREILRTPYLVPETKNVYDLLKEMQSNHLSIAIVVDEYGITQGLVTLEDLVEEIVGEIEDEHTIPDIIIDKGIYSIAGKAHIEEVENLLGIEVEKGDFSTIAGFLINIFGRIPEEGDEISYKGYNFKVDVADKRRIYRISIKKI